MPSIEDLGLSTLIVRPKRRVHEAVATSIGFYDFC